MLSTAKSTVDMLPCISSILLFSAIFFGLINIGYCNLNETSRIQMFRFVLTLLYVVGLLKVSFIHAPILPAMC